MRQLWPSLILLSCLIAATSGASNISASSLSTLSSTTSTCPYRTVNYITHSLPQQCHKSSWSSPSTTSAESSGPSATVPVSQNIVDQITTAAEPISSETLNSIPLVSEAPATSNSEQNSGSITLPSSREDAEPDSALGNANFLSFEDWKKQNLAKSGQSVDHIGNKHAQSNENKKRPSNIHTALDSLGDDAEIDLNFGSFSSERPQKQDTSWTHVADEDESGIATADSLSPKARLRNKDAGTTCKERFNYASFDCAATVLKTNPQASGAVSVLVEKNKDSYMLNDCSADNKFIILELCDDIAIDTVVLANFEFFSSTFRTFRVSVSDRYPVKLDKWKALGTYEARNTREIQAFLVENPLIWARYLRIEFLTHYGNEFYCPLSLVRVHGTTMMEDYKHDEVVYKADDEEDEEDSSLAVEAGEKLMPDAIAEVVLDERSGETHETAHEISDNRPPNSATIIDSQTNPSSELYTTSAYTTDLFASRNAMSPSDLPESMCAVTETITDSSSLPSTTSQLSSDMSLLTGPRQMTEVAHSASPLPTTSTLVAEERHTPPNIETLAETPRDVLTPPSQTSSHDAHTDITRSSATQPPPANPTMQESFFKSVQKRLQMLESNSSLSLQYIEEQSRILREAFSKVEQNQVAKTTGFLDYLNLTVLNELRDFRQQYDQIWQSTVIELETQREQYQREVLTMNARMGILADEVIFQKRMSILQSLLVLLCLGLVLFSRGALNSYLELPIVQNVITRSQNFRNSSTPDTPNASRSSSRPVSSHFRSPPKRGILRRYEQSTTMSEDEATQDEMISTSPVEIEYSPPTPTSQYGDDHRQVDGRKQDRATSPVPSFETIERPRSSPGFLTHGSDQEPTVLTNGISNGYAGPTLSTSDVRDDDEVAQDQDAAGKGRVADQLAESSRKGVTVHES